MIRHIVMFQWSDRASAADKELTIATLRNVPAGLPMLRGHHAGLNMAGRGHYDVAVTSDFETIEDLRAYEAHPAMRRVHEILMRTTSRFELFDLPLDVGDLDGASPAPTANSYD